MNTFEQFKDWAETRKAQGQLMLTIGDLHVQIYESHPLQLNVSINPKRWACLKLEERTPGKVTFAVASEDGKSIDYTNARTFSVEEPLESLYQAFPSENIRFIVNVLMHH